MKIIVIIPTYNEVENIARLIDILLKFQLNHLDVLIVDDNSPDGTGELVKKLSSENPRIHLIQREGKQGLGTAYVCGFKYAIEHAYDFIIQMDADFSHDPSEIKNFMTTIAEYDLVLGSRYIVGVNVVNWPLSRLLLSYGANLYTRLITQMPIKDSTGGFKCFRRAVLEAIKLDDVRSDGYAFQIEINFKTWKKGFRIKEIPIVFVDRIAGSSKMSKRIIREAAFMVWKLKFLSLLGKLK
ncbi:polyprenol monophosphomannose synthase [candidate division KSB1 bacterium]|nr:polyprenol monophosphomannose synthase [candidate division KSB1 bacterium]